MAKLGGEEKSVTARALAVLDAFDATHRHQSLSSIARRCNLPLTTTHRLVNQLVEADALMRCSDGAYEIGSKLWRLGLLASLHADLRELALPYMEDLYQLGVDAVQIAVLDGVKCLVVDRISGSRSMSVLSRPGARMPLHATGVGKVLLAFSPAELQDAAIGSLDRFTEQTITDADTIRSQIAQIRQTGVASTKEELVVGTISIAVPIKGYGGKVIAALGVLFAPTRKDQQAITQIMRVTADALSRKLVAAGIADPAGFVS